MLLKTSLVKNVNSKSPLQYWLLPMIINLSIHAIDYMLASVVVTYNCNWCLWPPFQNVIPSFYRFPNVILCSSYCSNQTFYFHLPQGEATRYADRGPIRAGECRVRYGSHSAGHWWLPVDRRQPRSPQRPAQPILWWLQWLYWSHHDRGWSSQPSPKPGRPRWQRWVLSTIVRVNQSHGHSHVTL